MLAISGARARDINININNSRQKIGLQKKNNMENFDVCYNELLNALQNLRENRPEWFFSIGRNVIPSLPKEMTMKDFFNKIPYKEIAFSQEKAQYISRLSGEDVVFFDNKVVPTTINGEKATIYFRFDEEKMMIIGEVRHEQDI